MNEFIPMLKPPKENDECFYSKLNVFYPKYGLPNCTAHVEGRWLKLYSRRTGCLHNAGGWVEEAKKLGLEISSVPRLGAIAVWKNPGTKDSGHVAVVEKIEKNGDILTSNSGYTRKQSEYKSMLFYTAVYEANKGYNWTSSKTGKKYELQGFILPPTDLTEKPKKAKVKYFCPLRSGAGHNNQVVCTVRQNTTFALDGQYDIIRNVKWVHGTYTTQNGKVPVTYSGWIEATNI